MLVCEYCGKEFPRAITYQGKRKYLDRKYCLECKPFPSQYNNEQLKLRLVTSKLCGYCQLDKDISCFRKRKYINSYDTYCRECHNLIIRSKQFHFKQQCVDYKGGKCYSCGYDKFIHVLHFHHIDPSTKSFNIGTNSSVRFNEKIRKELDKCIVLCANCHREHHSIKPAGLPRKSRHSNDLNNGKTCSKCKLFLPITYFSKMIQRPDKLHWHCYPCRSEQTIINKRNMKMKLLEYKGGCCSHCGYKKCIQALDFHHLNPNEKEYIISAKLHRKSKFNELKIEVDKCIILCSNCHIEQQIRAKCLMDNYYISV